LRLIFPPVCGGARVARIARVTATLLASRYRSIRKLGEGSMGVVHLAEDADGTRVAVKVLSKEFANDPDLAARLSREAAATRAIAHPNVARAIDVGRDADGTAWLVMEYVDGRPLRDVLTSGGALHPLRALRIARNVLEALAAAHASGVIHRDVKPENVMLVAAGEGFDQESVKVLDFGIAKLDAEKHALTGPSTNAGVVFGTPTYMAPEQIRREAPDARTDLYALGVMLFEMIAGAVPFDGDDDVTILARHMTLPPPPLSSPLAPEKLTFAVRAFVAKLLAKRPDVRPASAVAALAELDDAIASVGEVNATALRTGATLIPPGLLSGPAEPQGMLKKKTAKLVAFARSYGLTPQQLVFAFAVAFGLILLVLAVAITAAG